MMLKHSLAVLRHSPFDKQQGAQSNHKTLVKMVILIFLVVFLSPAGSWGGWGAKSNKKGHVIIRAGWPASVSLVGYDKDTASPLYQIVLPGVYQMQDKILIKAVVPKQAEATLNIGVNERGTISYSQCLELLKHLGAAYSFDYAFYDEAAIKKLQAGDEINVPEFTGMLKDGKVPPLSPSKLAEMEAAIKAGKP